MNALGKHYLHVRDGNVMLHTHGTPNVRARAGNAAQAPDTDAHRTGAQAESAAPAVVPESCCEQAGTPAQRGSSTSDRSTVAAGGPGQRWEVKNINCDTVWYSIIAKNGGVGHASAHAATRGSTDATPLETDAAAVAACSWKVMPRSRVASSTHAATATAHGHVACRSELCSGHVTLLAAAQARCQSGTWNAVLNCSLHMMPSQHPWHHQRLRSALDA
eukprot:366501-Chlamydomonas_euryale.AAC.31